MKRLRLLGLALPLAGIVFLLVSVLVGGAAGSSNNQKMRWDIVVLSPGSTPGTIDISPGGSASAAAEDGSKITVTGSGTFRSNSGESQAVTGGGTWSTSGAAGTGSGTYKVTGFVDFDVAPGTAPSPPFNDKVTGEGQNARAGLAVLQIAYSDGSNGVLVVSCHLPAGAPSSVFEGITASKGYTDYWNHDEPTGSPPFSGPNANRTQFHVVPGNQDNDDD